MLNRHVAAAAEDAQRKASLEAVYHALAFRNPLLKCSNTTTTTVLLVVLSQIVLVAKRLLAPTHTVQYLVPSRSRRFLVPM